MSKPFRSSILTCTVLALALHLSAVTPGHAQTAPASKTELKSTLQELKDQTKEIGESFIGKDNLDPLKKVELHSKSREAKAMTLMVNHYIDLQNQYQADLRAADWENFLSPERIQREPDQTQTQKMLAAAKQAFTRYESKVLDRQPLYDLSKQWSSNPKVQAGFKIGVDQGLDRRLPTLKKQLAIEKRILGQIEVLVTLLGDNKPQWTFENKEMLFYDEAILARYKKEFAFLEELLAEQEALLKQTMEEGQRSIEKFSNSL